MSSATFRSHGYRFLSPDRVRSQAATTICDIFPCTVLLGLSAVPAWFLGAYSASVQQWLAVAAAVGLIFSLPRLHRVYFRIPSAIVLLLCALLLGFLQLVPLPRDLRAWLSPVGTELVDELRMDLKLYSEYLPEVAALEQPWDSRSLSLYPASTRRQLGLIIIGTASFVLGTWLAASRRGPVWLCAAIAINGACFALFGIMQKLSWSGNLYWSIPVERGSPFAAFVNRNHAGAFLNLCLAGAIGAAIWVFQGAYQARPAHASKSLGLREFPRFVARLLPVSNALPVLAIVVAMVFIAAGVFCSFSRGAIVSMIAATLVCLIASRRRANSLAIVAVLGIISLSVVFYAGMNSALQQRLATLGEPGSAVAGRLSHWSDSIRGCADYVWAGSGLGTYRYAYPRYQERTDPSWYVHAENHYLEALFEGGLPGLVLLLALIGLVGASIWRLLRDKSESTNYALAMAGLFALTSQAVHGQFDFALYSSANCILLAVMCGVVTGRASQLVKLPNLPLPGVWSYRTHSALAPAVAILVVAVVWSATELRAVAAVESCMEEAKVERDADEVAPQLLEDLIHGLQAALVRRPDDAEGQAALADLWVDLYRTKALQELRQHYPENIGDARLRELVSPSVLHARVHQLQNNAELATLARLRHEPLIRNHLGPAVKHLVVSAQACPLIPEVHLNLARLCVFMPAGCDFSSKGNAVAALWPSDPDVLYGCGLLQYQGADLTAACEYWKRSLTHSTRHLDKILIAVKHDLSITQMMDMVFPTNPQVLLEVAQKYYSDDSDVRHCKALAERAILLLSDANLPEDKRFWLRGTAYRLQDMRTKAIENYAGAVELSPENTQWRYELALLQWQNGQAAAAHDNAKQCVRMEPDRPDYLALLKAITHERLTRAGANL